MRIDISDGLLYGSWEPSDLPGAFLLTWHPVILQATGQPVKSYDGPGQWIESMDGVPLGFVALWLGKPACAYPDIVLVSREPHPKTAIYEEGYRRGFTARRKPVLKPGREELYYGAVLDGWRDGVAYRARK